MLDVICLCVLYLDDVSSPIGTGIPGGRFYTRTGGRRYVFYDVPLAVSLSKSKICTLHNHIYVPARRGFVDVGLSPISVRTICHNSRAYICESESFCVQFYASPIHWRNGKSSHNVRIDIASLRAHTYISLDLMQAQKFGYIFHTSEDCAVGGGVHLARGQSVW